MISYDDLLRVRGKEKTYSWGDREVILYALGVGYGADPLDAADLKFVYEDGLRVVPAFATVAAWGSHPPVAAMGIDYSRVVHADQSIVLHGTLPVSGRVTAYGRVTGAVDKGPKGAIIFRETVLRDAVDGTPIATVASTIMARADGGFGGPTEHPQVPHPMPDRTPDVVLEYATRPDRALLFRLSGDRNPLHADPATASRAGFARPILHGLCSYGMTCRAVLRAFAEDAPERISAHQARFSAPMFPGETIVVHLWRDGPVVSFEARIKERDIAIIKNGKTLLR